MGSGSSKYHQDFGTIVVQTQQAYYQGGDVVTGNIYLRIVRPVESKFMEIEVKGKEKIKFLYHQDKETHIARGEHQIISFKAPCFNFSVQTLQPGDYVIPFSFPLPQGLPSSMFYQNKEIYAKPKAKIKYHIKALLFDYNMKVQMAYKQVLIVREPIKIDHNIKVESSMPVTTGCCVNQGLVKIDATFNKNTFEPHETCQAIVKFDNSQCNINMTNIRLAIEQELWIKQSNALFGGRTFSHRFPLVEKFDQGAPARHPKPEERQMNLDLKTVTYQIPTQKKKAGVFVPISPEDQYLMGQLQPASHGYIVRNEYFLAIRCRFDGCTCCATLPHVRIPLSVVPNVNLAFRQQEPQDFKPHVYEAFNFEVVHGQPVQDKSAI